MTATSLMEASNLQMIYFGCAYMDGETLDWAFLQMWASSQTCEIHFQVY